MVPADVSYTTFLTDEELANKYIDDPYVDEYVATIVDNEGVVAAEWIWN